MITRLPQEYYSKNECRSKSSNQFLRVIRFNPKEVSIIFTNFSTIVISGVEFEAIQPRESDIECIVMYGGGLTSYEAARIALKRYGHEAVEIWFADTRTEDEDLYRFNRDVEKLLDHEIIVFSQGLDIWGIFRRERFLGNSRIDPCSKFLKRAPLRRALEKRYPNRACVCCKEPWIKGGQTISVRDVDGTEIKEAICERCEVKDPKYSQSLNDLREIILVEGDGSQKSLIAMGRVQNRVERCSENGKFVRVVLGMDIIDDCDRLHRAKSYWRPFVNWFPLIEPPFGNKSRIIKELRSAGVREPRLYGAGFVHNNCGGFCVKAGKGQMAHLLNLFLWKLSLLVTRANFDSSLPKLHATPAKKLDLMHIILA